MLQWKSLKEMEVYIKGMSKNNQRKLKNNNQRGSREPKISVRIKNVIYRKCMRLQSLSCVSLGKL
jgi:hypothetical protein